MSSLHTLPKELVHHIFDHLDGQTILLSLRYVCKRLYGIADTYNQYKFDFSSMSKPDFHRTCRIFRPEDIISLTLSNGGHTPGAIDLFISLVHVDRFSRLRSLTLIDVKESDLEEFLKHAIKCPLTNLSIKDEHCHKLVANERAPRVCSAISQLNLRKLNLAMGYGYIHEIKWPIQCMLQHLTVSMGDMESLYIVLGYLPHLRTIVFTNFYTGKLATNETIFRQSDLAPSRFLTSLSLQCDNAITMAPIEFFLSCISTLTHLRLVGIATLSDPIFDGSRWERFIEAKLPLLNKFEFFISSSKNIQPDKSVVESLIEPFRTPFWLESKRFFVTCDYIEHKKQVQLYSIPLCTRSFLFYAESTKISCSTLNIIDNDPALMDSVHHVSFNLTEIITDAFTQSVCIIIFL
jgi:hypothetical protein